MTSFTRSYARWIIGHRRLALGVMLLLTAVLGRAATRLHVEIDPDRQLPQDHPYVQTLNDLHRLFGDKNLVVVGIFPHDGNTYETLLATADSRMYRDKTKRKQRIARTGADVQAHYEPPPGISDYDLQQAASGVL